MPNTPDLHLFPTMWTPQGIAPCTLLISLLVRQPGDDFNGAPDYTFNLGQSRLNRHPHLGKRLGRLYAVIADALEPFGHRMLHLCGAYNYVAKLTQRKILPHFRGQTSPQSSRRAELQ
jgi:hypothetical protein